MSRADSQTVLKTADELERLASAIFELCGVHPETSRLVARSLVLCNLAGHDSHGVIRVKEYVGAVKSGVLNPRAQPGIECQAGAVVLVNGGGGFGQPAARLLMDSLMQKAGELGISAGALRNSGHIGRLGEYVEMAAEKGMVGMAFANGGAAQPRVAPHGGAKPLFGTNPVASALPSIKDGPIVVDFSTAATAAGKIRLALDKKEPLSEGMILDAMGHPSTNPEDYYNGGMLLPAAGHKGFALGLLAEALAGLLSGEGSMALDGKGRGTRNGAFFVVIDPQFFGGRESFAQACGQLQGAVRNVPPADPGKPVLAPGDPERLTISRRRKEGIPLPVTTWQDLVCLAREIGVPMESDTRLPAL